MLSSASLRPAARPAPGDRIGLRSVLKELSPVIKQQAQQAMGGRDPPLGLPPTPRGASAETATLTPPSPRCRRRREPWRQGSLQARPRRPRMPRGLRPTLREMEQQPPAPLAPWQPVKLPVYLKQANEPGGRRRPCHAQPVRPAPPLGRPGRRRTRPKTWPSRPLRASPCRQTEREDDRRDRPLAALEKKCRAGVWVQTNTFVRGASIRE